MAVRGLYARGLFPNSAMGAEGLYARGIFGAGAGLTGSVGSGGSGSSTGGSTYRRRRSRRGFLVNPLWLVREWFRGWRAR